MSRTTSADVKRRVHECETCVHRRQLAGTRHIACGRPDPDMTTHNPSAVQRGWFFYPIAFDPVWKGRDCAKYEPVTKDGDA
jgi:hypothetical protein